jgi:hypothetical protein
MSNTFIVRIQRISFVIFVVWALSGCAINSFLVDGVAGTLTAEDDQEEDLQLARDASPFYLKFTEGLLKSSPKNAKLVESVSSGFTKYAYAFIAFEADKLEQKDFKGAEILRERASKMYARAYAHTLRFWELKYPGFEKKIRSSNAPIGIALDKSQVGLLYWSAASLGGWISTAKDQPDLVADFPIALHYAQLAWELEPGYSQGSLASLMGTFEWANPNGSKIKAAKYFDKAIEYSKDKSAGPFVAKAEIIAVSKKDKKMFEALLNKAISIAQKTPNLENETMRLRAIWLLENEEDLLES